MSKHDPKVTLFQIADHARRAQELCTQNTLPEILTDWQKRAAFERVMEVLGQSVQRLPADLRQRHPSVPWQTLIDLGNQISASHDGIDYASLWKIASKEAPGLLATVRHLLEELPTGNQV